VAILWLKGHCCLERKGNSNASEGKAAAIVRAPAGSEDGGGWLYQPDACIIFISDARACVRVCVCVCVCFKKTRSMKIVLWT
jgi:hypothetical protein